MGTLKVMSIIGLVLAILTFLSIIVFNNIDDYEAGLGWGLYAASYLIAFSIVVLTKLKK